VALIRKAKAEGLSVTCETAPHYLLLTQDDLKDDGRFKMNPPLRDKADREALIEGILDGTIDVIATDHAPHAAHEKLQGLRGSLMGIVGLETALPLLYTEFVKTKILTFEKLLALLHDNALKLFGLGSNLEVGAPADLTVFDPECRYIINPAEFASMGKSTPFEDREVYGKFKMTAVGGEIVWKERDFG
jgi:dihydroorotase